MGKPRVWYASGGGIALSGPFASQVEAYAAFRLAPGHGGLFPDDLRVWPDTRTRAELVKAIEADRDERRKQEVRRLIDAGLKEAMSRG